MALKKVKTESAGGAHKARYVTRAEAKAAAKKARRETDKAACTAGY